MRLIKVLAGLLLLLAVGLAVMAWMVGRQNARTAVTPAATVNSAAQPGLQEPAPKKYAQVVAAKALPAAHRIGPDDVMVVSVSEPPAAGLYAEIAPLLGHTTLLAVAEQQPIFENQLIAGLSLQLENGQRAVSIAVKEPMAAGHHIRPGDFVDVFFTLEEDDKNIKAETQTRLLLPRARVLAYGQATVENPPLTHAQRQAEKQKESTSPKTTMGSNGREETRGRAEIPNTALLAVPLEDVQRLTLAEKFGALHLALRHPDDMAMPDAALFASLPLALRPVRLDEKKENVLPAIDKAYAGITLKGLSEGGKEKNHISTLRNKNNASPAKQIELLNGNSVQKVHY